MTRAIWYNPGMEKIVVISGATSGLGKALAEKFRADGDVVCGLSRSCAESETDYPCDVSDEGQVNAAVDYAVDLSSSVETDGMKDRDKILKAVQLVHIK